MLWLILFLIVEKIHFLRVRAGPHKSAEKRTRSGPRGFIRSAFEPVPPSGYGGEVVCVSLSVRKPRMARESESLLSPSFTDIQCIYYCYYTTGQYDFKMRAEYKAPVANKGVPLPMGRGPGWLTCSAWFPTEEGIGVNRWSVQFLNWSMVHSTDKRYSSSRSHWLLLYHIPFQHIVDTLVSTIGLPPL